MLHTVKPDIVLSNNDNYLSSPEIIESISSFVKKFSHSVKISGPYKGSFITQKYAHTPTGLYQDHTFGKKRASR